MYRESHNLLLASLYLGHASVDVTGRYLNISHDDMHSFGENFSNTEGNEGKRTV